MAWTRLDKQGELFNKSLAKLDEIIAYNIEKYKNDRSALETYIDEVKECSKEFTNVSHDLICSLYKNGSTAEANTFRDTKREKKQEAKEVISCAIGLLETLHGIDLEISNINSDSTFDFTYRGRSQSATRDFREESPLVSTEGVLRNSTPISLKQNETCMYTPTATLGSLKLTSHDDALTSGQCHQTKLFDESASLFKPVSAVDHQIVEPLKPRPSLDDQSHQLSFGRYISSQRSELPTTSVGVRFSHPISSIHESASLFKPVSAVDHQIVEPLKPRPSLDDQSHQLNFGRCISSQRSDLPTTSVGVRFSHPISSILGGTSNVSSSGFTNNTPHCSTVGSGNYRRENFQTLPLLSHRSKNVQNHDFHSSKNSSAFHEHSTHQYPVTPRHYDSSSAFLIKQQLFHKAPNPFAGDPQHFHSWMNALSNKTRDVDLSDWDMLLVLEANTIKEPLKVVQRHMSIGGPNPARTLDNTIHELRSEFGSGIRIANALNNQLDAFPIVKSPYQVDKLKELLEICQYVEANIDATAELSIFNSAFGARKAWLKLPESWQNSWRSVCDDFRSKNYDEYPYFSVFVKFLSKKIREFSDPLFQRSTFHTEYRKRDITLKTSFEESIESAVEDENEARKTTSGANSALTCPLHSNGNHDLNDCRKFEKMNRSERIDLLKSNGLCFLCFGQHLRTNCTAKVKCKFCDGTHNSLLHFQKSEEYQPIASNLCTGLHDGSVSKSCSKVLLVDVSIKGSSKRPLRCYAIVDEQSTSTFADPKVANYFQITGPTVDYTLQTLSNIRQSTRGILLTNIVVKGVEKEDELASLLSILILQYQTASPK